MRDVKENYRWEAERPDGTVFSDGGDLSGCVRFSLIPAVGTGLPKHDFIGVPVLSRFCRAFQKVKFAGRETLPGLLFWEDGSPFMKTTEDLTGKLKPGEYVGKGVAGDDWYMVADVTPDMITLLSPYHGKTKKNGMAGRRLDANATKGTEQYLHCVETPQFRFWVDSETGAVLTTPKDYELRL